MASNFWQQMAEADTLLHMYDDVFSDGKPKPTKYGGQYDFDDVMDACPEIVTGNVPTVGTVKPTEYDNIFK